MAHHVEIMSSQIVPLSNETTINNIEAALATMVNTTRVIDIIIYIHTPGRYGLSAHFWDRAENNN
jgi:hypothetical protein